MFRKCQPPCQTGEGATGLACLGLEPGDNDVRMRKDKSIFSTCIGLGFLSLAALHASGTFLIPCEPGHSSTLFFLDIYLHHGAGYTRLINWAAFGGGAITAAECCHLVRPFPSGSRELCCNIFFDGCFYAALMLGLSLAARHGHYVVAGLLLAWGAGLIVGRGMRSHVHG